MKTVGYVRVSTDKQAERGSKRFLITTASGSGAASPPLTVVTNWNAGLKK
jgi:hypothetical protein